VSLGELYCLGGVCPWMYGEDTCHEPGCMGCMNESAVLATASGSICSSECCSGSVLDGKLYTGHMLCDMHVTMTGGVQEAASWQSGLLT